MIKGVLGAFLFWIKDFLEKKVIFYIYRLNIKKDLIIVGRHTYGASKIRLDHYKGSEVLVKIGSFTSIAPEVRIITGGIHPSNWVSLFPMRIAFALPKAYEDGTPYTKGPIEIGNDVWIGTSVIITSGVNIGDGVLILPGSVVSKNIPPYAIAGGVPAKVINYRFDEKTINSLLKIQWWNWDDKKIMEEVPLLSSTNISDFLIKHI